MINVHDFYVVLTSMTPLYAAMFLGYASVRWWKIFTPDQCSAINRFVAMIAIPSLSFHYISKSNPYAMNLRFIAADTLQKVIVLGALTFWARFTKMGSLDWLITIFPVSTIPNTPIIGVPLLVAMYGEYCESLMIQIVMMQLVVWYTLLLFLFEYRAAKVLLNEQYPDTAESIKSFRVDSCVSSLHENTCIETDTTSGRDSKLHVILPKSETFDSKPPPSSSLTLSRAQSYPMHKPSFSKLLATVDTESPNASAKSQVSNNEVRLSISDNKVNTEPQDANSSVIRPSGTGKQVPRTSVMIWSILVEMGRKLSRNPNNFASLIGLVWSLIHFRWNIKMPLIIANSISLLSDGCLGMTTFTTGLFMAIQPSLIPCGKTLASYAMVLRFLIGPLVMAAASLIVGIRGELFRVAIVQAALPQGILPFVFAKEYNLHPQIHCTAVVFGMVIAIPVALVYYILLGL